MSIDPDAIVEQVRELAVAARAASKLWTLAALPVDPEHPEHGTCRNPPDDERQVLVFLNGHVDISDMEGRNGGGWGRDLGWFDHGKGYWRVGGHYNEHVTHWIDLPPDPERS